MTTRSKTYYQVRTGVRWAFYTTLGGLLVFGGSWAVERAYGDDRPTCLVNLGRDFTWSPAGTDLVTLRNCQAPRGVVLHGDGRWAWSE